MTMLPVGGTLDHILLATRQARTKHFERDVPG